MKVMVIGATSAIAHEVSRCFAADNAALFLVARSAEKLAAAADDLKVLGAAKVETYVANLADLSTHTALIEAGKAALGGIDAVLIAHGVLGDQKLAQQSVAATLELFNINAISYISLITLLANHFEAQRQGCLAVIGSVAGDRGRASNYIYGAAKGAVALFMGGVRNRLAKVGVSVLTVKPGFVDTPMTAHMKKNALFAKPEQVAKRIYTAMLKGEDVIYVPSFWMLIMFIIRNIPERIFKRLNL
ncbi:MAG: short-chain dehydrogenase [Candidatus Thermofonsia Clade 1 bacterium]|jgi:short-subunit dehydrogenase|uniref:Short-chain dehydrogenase n=4 Tax=Candidatus Thermofonsia Clade 1 bacterium TaxID=2364210 RepID=A0A2M8Q0P9_9CHLR|nr:MAG: short-chain dehydrogenase [Candidatus Thermofonsia Clade 1 bacterium]